MKRITTLLFDVDGTVLDTTEFIVQAFEHALRAFEYEVPNRGIICGHMGLHIDDCYFALTGTKDHARELVEAHKSFQEKNYHLSRAFPNTAETLDTLRGRGYRLGAVTTRYRRTAVETLKMADLLSRFDSVVCGDDVHAVKPDPEPLYKAMELLGESPEHSAMIGDTHIDIEAGKNAGIKTIRATYGFHQDKMHDPEPDHFIDDISELLEIFP